MYYIFLLKKKKKVLYFIFNDVYNLCVLDQYFSFDFLTYLLLCNCINASNFLFKYNYNFDKFQQKNNFERTPIL